MIDANLLDNERSRFFIRTQGGVNALFVGVIFWSSIGVAGFYLSPRAVCLTVFSFIVIMLPIALIAGKRLVKKLLLKSPLAGLMLPSLVPALMSFGITIPLYFSDITLVPVAFVLGLSFHWPAFAWLYNWYGYITHSSVRTFLAVSFWVFFPEYLFTLLPLLIGALYLVTAGWVLIASKRATESLGPPIR